MTKPITWNDPSLTEQLTMLWEIGLSTAEIMRQMGMTKGQIVGRAQRLNLAHRPSPLPKPRPAPLQPNTKGCCFIEGDPLAPGLTFDEVICGASVDRIGGAYCAAHHARVWVRQPPRVRVPTVNRSRGSVA